MDRSRRHIRRLGVTLLAALAMFLPGSGLAQEGPEADPAQPVVHGGGPAHGGTGGLDRDPGALGRRLSFTEVVRESLFGEASVDDWTPLSWRNLFTEGWDTPFVFSPPSDSGALRQEWINAANGVFYRQWVLDYAYHSHVGSHGDQHIGSWFIFAPLSRRLELLFTVPFVDVSQVGLNRVPSSPGTGRSGQSASAGNPHSARYEGDIGDLSVTPQVLIHETRNTSIMSILTIRTPTGDLAQDNGHTSLGPQLQFWQGLPRRWVVRGGAGPTIPLGDTGLRTTFDSNLTFGKFLTIDEYRYFKEFTVYFAANASTTTDQRGPNSTTLTLLPGLRFRVTPDTWFLYGVETSVAGQGHEN